jgi:hypothetical protein
MTVSGAAWVLYLSIMAHSARKAISFGLQLRRNVLFEELLVQLVG